MSDEEKTRAAIVTGGAQGIGRAVAERFVQDGMAVLIADSDAEACEEATDALSRIGHAAAAVCDVSNEEDVRQAISKALGAFGRLDVLVCNAGIGFSGVPVTELTMEEWQRVINVNLTGCFLCAKHGVPHLRKTRGCIITIASTRAIQSEPDTEAYAASKGGITALTHALAVSLGPEIRVNCISPGWIETRAWQKRKKQSEPEHTAADHAQHPAGRVGDPRDVAALAAFLGSGEAGFVTGQNFIADGGMTRKMIYVE